MTKLFQHFLVPSILIHLQVVLLSGKTQPNSSTDKNGTKPQNVLKLFEPGLKKLNQVKYKEHESSHDEKLETLNYSSTKDSSTLHNLVTPTQCMKTDYQIRRDTRSIGNKKKTPKSQFDQLCGRFGRQPCTCYYPDHPDVTIFELSSDEITFSKMNVTGPSNCTDLQALGYSLKGFYMVWLNNKRIQTIYCDFIQTIERVKSMPFTNESDASLRPEFSDFCNGLQSQPCKALYSDYPDIQLFDFNQDKSPMYNSMKNNIKGLFNCEDLYSNGYYLNGFYWVSLNAKKVKLVYCDFNEMEGKYKKNLGIKRLVTRNNTSTTGITSSANLPNCNAVGSQPCSCFYSNFRNLLQFELSNDELTREATSSNGIGPNSCEELKNIGYTFDGFYVVRFKTDAVKIVYCTFNFTEKDEYNQESTTQSTLKHSRTQLKTTQPPVTDVSDIISRLRNLKQDDKCLDATWQKTFVGKFLKVFECDNSTKSQQWVLRNGSYICSLVDVCLAIKPLFSKEPLGTQILTTMPYNETVASKQQWVFYKNRCWIVHSKSGYRLSLGNEYMYQYQAEVVEKERDKNKNQEWSLEPIPIEE